MLEGDCEVVEAGKGLIGYERTKIDYFNVTLIMLISALQTVRSILRSGRYINHSPVSIYELSYCEYQIHRPIVPPACHAGRALLAEQRPPVNNSIAPL